MIRVRWIAISFVMRQWCSPHIGMFSLLHRECINLHEGRLRNKMHLHSTLKGCFFSLLRRGLFVLWGGFCVVLRLGRKKKRARDYWYFDGDTQREPLRRREVFFCVKRFWPITRVENDSQEKFTILPVPHIGFLCYSNWDQILLYGRWLESKDEYTYRFMKFC